MMLFLAEVLTKTSQILCVRVESAQDPHLQYFDSLVTLQCNLHLRAVWADWSGEMPPQNLLRFQQMQHSPSDIPSWMGPFPTNWPAKPHKAANGSAGWKRFSIKPQSQSEQILTTCNCAPLNSAKLNCALCRDHDQMCCSASSYPCAICHGL